MKFKEFNSENAIGVVTTIRGTEAITFQWNGAVIFSKKLSERLKLKVGDTLTFVQDEENPRDWYMAINKEKGLPVKMFTSGGEKDKLNIFSSVLIKAFFDSIGYTEKPRLSLQMGTEPLEKDKVSYWPVITAGVNAQRKTSAGTNEPYQFKR